MNAATEITNLLYLYAELLDGGDLDGAAALFDHATLKTVGGKQVDARGLRALWDDFVKLHPDGTPMTKHVITNPILAIDEKKGEASCRSYYTVLQATPDLPLQVVGAGRYHDTFERVDGVWRFATRDYSLFDHQGNLGEHLLSGVSKT